MRKSKVLVVDDDRFSRTFCRQILEEENALEVEEASGVDEALTRINEGDIDLVISDLVMPEKTGLDLVEALRLESPSLGVIMITGHATIESAVKAMKLGALDYIRKPLNPTEFKIVVHRALDQVRLAEENRELRSSLKLYDVSSKISRTIEIEELYDIIFDLMMQETGATRGFLYLVDQEQGESNVIVAEGFDQDLNDDLDKRVFQAYNKELSNITEPYLPDIIHPIEIKFRSSSDPAKSLLFIPLRNKSELVGMVVFFDTERDNAFGERDTQVAHFLCEVSEQYS
jgi:FixJ family two-component response regulator